MILNEIFSCTVAVYELSVCQILTPFLLKLSVCSVPLILQSYVPVLVAQQLFHDFHLQQTKKKQL